MADTHDPNRILWLDLETTGLVKPTPGICDTCDDAGGNDIPLEVGAVMTNMLLEKRGQFVRLVSWPGFDPSNLPDAVRDMHHATGLLDDLAKHADNPKAMAPIDEVEKQLLDWMGRTGHETGRTMLAGSGVVHFDQFFLHRYMPTLMSELHHGLIDMGEFRRFADLVTGNKTLSEAHNVRPTRAHRALDDARAAVHTAHRWAASFSTLQA